MEEEKEWGEQIYNKYNNNNALQSNRIVNEVYSRKFKLKVVIMN